ncbi:MAG: ATP-dependent metallopeptidase FtsH/Yme1/Tma family protein [Alphaproteobacteria bacterium]|jgi:cell division protease FtsH|nr:ATP-dependent metallopeptidase FtsH/Yme1/Tma family protein [Alphaproteobacteria bacterium]
MNKNTKNLIIWLAIFGVLIIVSNNLSGNRQNQQLIDFSDFLLSARSGGIISVEIKDNNVISGLTKNGTNFTTNAPNYPDLVKELDNAGVRIKVKAGDNMKTSLIAALISWLPFILIIAVWVYFLKKMGKGNNNPLSFGRSKAKMYMSKDTKITFKDVAGVDEAKDEIMELVDFLRAPDKFKKLGGKIPKGCLLVGNPGTGKTLLAKAIAGEAQVPFFSISGSDFVEMFVGVGASRVRDLFEQAKKNAPAIIFIDEIDAVGRHRGAGVGGGNDEREQTLNQLLVEMDGFQENEGVIIIAATNRPDVLDKALLRPGRFDRQITVPNPDIKGRKKILKVHAKAVAIAPDVDLETIAKGTPGFAGAELQNLVNEAALHAARHNKKMVTMKDFEYAKDRILMGSERRSMVMRDEEKKLTAFHEAGHAIVTVFSAASDPIHKATIMPRGSALGMVMRLPENDKLSMTTEALKADIAVAMGGRVAEEIVFGKDKITSGASSDIQQATKLSKMMVLKWGMSEAIGPVLHEMNQEDFISNDKANLIDEEIKKLVEEGYATATKLIKKHLKKLNLLAEALIEYETLSGEEIKLIVAGKKIRTAKKESSKKTNTKKTSLNITEGTA